MFMTVLFMTVMFMFSRECQVGHWQKHKPACDLMFDSLKKLKEQEEARGVKS